MKNEIIEKEEKKSLIKVLIGKKGITKSYVFEILIFICLVLFSIIIAPKTLQNDTFYTIKCGEFIFQNGITNLGADEFSWLDLPYTYPHWLYDLMIYVIYAKAGMFGIYVSTVAFSTCLGFIIYKFSKWKSQNRFVSAVLTFLAMYCLESYVAARAQLVTFCLFAFELFCLEKLYTEKKKRYGLFLIIIGVLIAQLHVAVYPMYFIFFLPYLGEFLCSVFLSFNVFSFIKKISYKIKMKLCKKEEKLKDIKTKFSKFEQDEIIRKNRREKNLANPYKVEVEKNIAVLLMIAIAGIVVIFGMFHPTGFTAYTYLYKTMIGNTTQSINEHLPLTLIDSPEFAVALIIFIVLLTFMDLKIKLRDLFLMGGLTLLAFKTKRQISLFVIAGTPVLSNLLAQFFVKYDPKTCEKLVKVACSVIGIVAIIGGFGYETYNRIQEWKDEEYISTYDYPVSAVEWIKNNLDLNDLKIYNEYNYGAYLVYQDVPVFIDSRADLYAPEFNDVEGYANAGDDIFSDALDIPSLSRGYEDIFEKYGVKHVMLYDNAKMCLLLDGDSKYNLLYKDDRFRVYERLEN